MKLREDGIAEVLGATLRGYQHDWDQLVWSADRVEVSEETTVSTTGNERVPLRVTTAELTLVDGDAGGLYEGNAVAYEWEDCRLLELDLGQMETDAGQQIAPGTTSLWQPSAD